jgi:hypothetical protein
MEFKFGIKDMIHYGSFIVSLSVAYYTHEIRIVRIETKNEQVSKDFDKIEKKIDKIESLLMDVSEYLRGKNGKKD